MPKRPTREGQHLVATDHWIRRNAPPPKTPPIPKPDGNYELVPVWPEASPPAIRAAALVQLHLSLAPQRPSLEKGVAALEELRAKGPLGPLAESQLATGLIELGRPAEATPLLEELVRQRPQDASLWLRLALARNRKGSPDALSAYERAIELSPDNLEAYSPAVRLHLLKGNLSEAERLLEAQAARRLDASARIERALVGSQRGEAPDRLLLELGEALFIEPGNIVGLLLQAELLANNGKRDEARAICRRVLELQPNHPAALNMLRQLSGE
jgi:tetratricopeptide (TPR) repeat protein